MDTSSKPAEATIAKASILYILQLFNIQTNLNTIIHIQYFKQILFCASLVLIFRKLTVETSNQKMHLHFIFTVKSFKMNS